MFASLVLGICTAALALAQQPGIGTLFVRATLGPALPAGRPIEAPCPSPAVGRAFRVSGKALQEPRIIETDERGAGRVPLPPGSYLLEYVPPPGIEFTKDLPAEVVVEAGSETVLDIRIDTGIR